MPVKTPVKDSIKKSSSSQLLNAVLASAHRFFFIIVIIAFAAITIAGYLFLVQPKYTAIAEETKNKEDKENQQLQDLQSYLARLFQYREQYNKIDAAAKDKIDAMIAGKYSPEDVFTGMEKLIAARGLILNSISVSTAASSGEDKGDPTASNVSGVGRATIKLEITGVNYEGLKQLLTVIESNMQLSDVKKIDFAPDQNKATLEITTYYLN
jgi:hypothetical protein